MCGDEEQRAIRILERDRDAIRGEWRLRAEFAFGFDPLRPLGGAWCGKGVSLVTILTSLTRRKKPR
jgi:hypothetical protein